MNFTIVDYLWFLEDSDRPEEVPYKWTDKDSQEWESGEYLKTKDSFRRVIKAIAEENNLTTKSRIRELSDKRKFLFYIARKKGGLRFSEIGRLFNRDHSTVVHGINSYNEIKDFEDFKSETEELRKFFSKIERLNKEL